MRQQSAESNDNERGNLADSLHVGNHEFRPFGERREFFGACKRGLAVATTLGSASISPRTAIAVAEESTKLVHGPAPNLDCLLDLPLHDAEQQVRLYFCRHGQTENNRLGKIQGARMNPSLNEVGQEQAQRLGKALSRTIVSGRDTNILGALPTTIFHSPLLRAEETARIVARCQNEAVNKRKKFRTQALSGLNEIDFGPSLEGELIRDYRVRMVEVYSKWSVGEVDERMGGEGENAREILGRMQSAFATLLQAASTSPTGAVAAITHSAYLKMLLSAVSNAPLLQVRKVEQQNCCINVVDVSREDVEKLLASTDGSSILPGIATALEGYRVQPSSHNAIAPKLQRVNEKRHLVGLV